LNLEGEALDRNLYRTGFGRRYGRVVRLHMKGKKRVKCTLVQALRLCRGRTAHRGSRGIALLFHDHRH